MVAHYLPTKSICQCFSCDQSANLFAYKCTALTLIGLNVFCLALNQYTILVCVYFAQYLFVFYYYLIPRAPSLMFGCTVSVGQICVCVFVQTCVQVSLSMWYSSSIPTISSEPSVNKEYLGTSQKPNERCTSGFFPVTVGRHFCTFLVGHNWAHVLEWNRFLIRSCLPAFTFSPLRWDTPITACVWGCALMWEGVCMMYICAWGWRTEDKCMRDREQDRGGKAAEIIHIFHETTRQVLRECKIFLISSRLCLSVWFYF